MVSILGPNPAADSRHQRHHETVDFQPYRDPFQRDRDRVLYSSAFRRLAGITQVVHSAQGHVFHNRLTHTMKVAQIGRRLTNYLLDPKRTAPDLITAIGGINEDVVETACFCHDLGHPPFGHAGEETLDKQTRQHGLICGFEGNAQSFHIVTMVTVHKEEYPGLDLTRASLNAMLKYPWSHKHPKGSKKWGYYDEVDTDDFEWARQSLDLGLKHELTAEAEIMDWADEVSYSVHDIDDFFRAGFIPLDQIVTPSGEQDRFLEWACQEKIIPSRDSVKDLLENLFFFYKDLFHEKFRETKAQLAEAWT